jgi:hypothetical protein
MKTLPFSSLEVMGRPCQSRPGDPQRFIPVFDTREAAVAWDDGCETYVVKLERGAS